MKMSLSVNIFVMILSLIMVVYNLVKGDFLLGALLWAIIFILHGLIIKDKRKARRIQDREHIG